ncbi:hypothetical protein AB9K21_04190 [Anaplasma phagocytophilum]
MKTGANSSSNDTSKCGGKGGSGGSSADSPQYLKEFVEKTLIAEKDENKNWPTSTEGGDTTRKPTPNDKAEAVAGDLTKKLTTEEKTIVAGLLAKTIEGGEVVEIRAVSATSVMVNSSGYAESHHMM